MTSHRLCYSCAESVPFGIAVFDVDVAQHVFECPNCGRRNVMFRGDDTAVGRDLCRWLRAIRVGFVHVLVVTMLMGILHYLARLVLGGTLFDSYGRRIGLVVLGLTLVFLWCRSSMPHVRTITAAGAFLGATLTVGIAFQWFSGWQLITSFDDLSIEFIGYFIGFAGVAWGLSALVTPAITRAGSQERSRRFQRLLRRHRAPRTRAGAAR